MLRLSIRFEQQNGEWVLIMEMIDDDNFVHTAIASVPFEMIADMAPPCQISSGVE